MGSQVTYSLKEIADSVGGEVRGDGSIVIAGLAKIQDAGPGDLTFLANQKYAKFVAGTDASAIILGRDYQGECPIPGIIADDPYYAFLRAVELFFPKVEQFGEGIDPSAVIDDSARLGQGAGVAARVVIGRGASIGRNVRIHPGAVLYPGVKIGDDCLIYSNVTVREGVQIGSRVIIHSGVVIGADGFGFVHKDGVYCKLPQTGTVIIEDDVEIGANTTIDRATLGATLIRRGSKLDNLIQIAHNVEIGENTVIAAQAGISGSVKVGRNVQIGGQAGFVGHISIGDNSIIGAQAGVSKDVPPGAFVMGYPARDVISFQRSAASLLKLPELARRVRRLEKELERLLGEGATPRLSGERDESSDQ